MQTFQDRLIATREQAGLTQTQLARHCDMAPTQLARYENGKAVPRRAVLKRLADALEVSAAWLSAGLEEPSASSRPRGVDLRTPSERAQLKVRVLPRPDKGADISIGVDGDVRTQLQAIARAQGKELNEYLQDALLSLAQTHQVISALAQKHEITTTVPADVEVLAQRLKALLLEAGVELPKK